MIATVNVPLGFVIAIVGGCLAIVGSLIILNLRSIKNCVRGWTQRINKQEERIEQTKKQVTAVDEQVRDCKLDCERRFVSAELFLRETGFTRRSLEAMTASVNRMDGKLTVVEKLPQICGDISREIVKEMKNSVNNGK